MIEFNEQDVWKVARAILEDPVHLVENGRSDFDVCIYCCKKHPHTYVGKNPPFEHEKDCPVLIAQDLLTGAAS